MQANEYGHSLVKRSRHGKRLPQDPATGLPDPAADSPATDPTPPQPPAAPTVTVFVDPNGTLTTPGAPPPASESDAEYVTVTSVINPTPTPSPSGKSAGDNGSNGTQPGGAPVGTIVGVVLAIIIILGAIGAFFFFRRRSMQNRMKTRGWINNKNDMAPASSFLFLGDKEESSSTRGVNPVAPFASPKAQNRAELSKDFTYPRPPPPTFNSYQPSNNGLPYVPPPAPPRPPPAHGYDYQPSAPPSPPIVSAPVPPSPKSAGMDVRSLNSAASRFTPSMASVSVLSPLTPGTMPPLPTLPSPYPVKDTFSPMTFAQPALPSITAAFPEMVKIRSTYIPTLPDELSIDVGETVRVKKEFDDGWALCVNARGEQGMIPQECLERERSRESKKLARASSLAARAYGGI